MRRGTYSIVARDEQTGSLGVAVQSHWFGVGAVVTWAEPGVGAVATQSLAEPAYGPRALDLLRSGSTPEEALAKLTREDEAEAVRQVGVVDAQGRTAVHTGRDCVRYAGHRTGPGYSCQANMMLGDSVPDAMATAFEAASGPLAERLLAALDAGEGAGGDVRGRQSAALLVRPAEGESWRWLVDLRVDDHPAPLPELRRLYDLNLAYEITGRAEDLTAEGRHDEAAPLYEEAAERAPESDELLFWAGLGAAQAGDIALGVERVKAAARISPRWLELLDRLEPAVAPSAAAVRTALSTEGES
ncbi:MAG: hypothetical protein QOH46_2343 [Solirubrobacteraceae bacterium]|nr:hypothetical protein [Solirubrobacteraceae bacterium]